MPWSKVRTKVKKPLGWWYLKFKCEYFYWVKNFDKYYNNLYKMIKKYNINLYGEKC